MNGKPKGNSKNASEGWTNHLTPVESCTHVQDVLTIVAAAVVMTRLS